MKEVLDMPTFMEFLRVDDCIHCGNHIGVEIPEVLSCKACIEQDGGRAFMSEHPSLRYAELIQVLARKARLYDKIRRNSHAAALATFAYGPGA